VVLWPRKQSVPRWIFPLRSIAAFARQPPRRAVPRARSFCAVIESAVRDAEPPRPKRRLNFDKPIIPSTGKPIDLTNEQIYDLIEFP
jgi:hypothetical protein